MSVESLREFARDCTPMQPERTSDGPRVPVRQKGSRPGGNRADKVVNINAASTFIWRGPDYPLLTPGRYVVRGTLFQGPEWVRSFQRWSLRIEFALVHETASVSAFFNFGNDKSGGKLGRQSRYYKAWVIANGELPKRGQDMNPSIFLDGQFFEVEVANIERDSEGNQKTEAETYSRIVKIISSWWP